MDIKSEMDPKKEWNSAGRGFMAAPAANTSFVGCSQRLLTSPKGSLIMLVCLNKKSNH